MVIIYTDHLLYRIKLRRIDFDLPKKVYLEAEEIFFDIQTKHYVALGRGSYFGKTRLLSVAFDKFSDKVELITIHPIDEEDRNQRLKSKRWISR